MNGFHGGGLRDDSQSAFRERELSDVIWESDSPLQVLAHWAKMHQQRVTGPLRSPTADGYHESCGILFGAGCR